MPGPSEPLASNLVSSASSAAFLSERETLLERLAQDEQSAAWRLRAALPDWQRPARYEDLGNPFATLSAALEGRFERSTLLAINRLLIVDLAMRLSETMATRVIPDDVLALYPAATARLIAYLRDVDDPDYCYPSERYMKDLRFVSGLTVPCGAQVVDLRSVIGHKALLHWLLSQPAARHVATVLRWRDRAPWFRIHTESRHLDDFNEAGWNACYVRIAALLQMHPDVLGMAGTSWFYDPQLESISPRLSYLRLRPMEGGASIVRHGTSDFDIRAATSTSETRRRLYEAGKYRPAAYTLLWPREALLDWALVARRKRP
jgi:hypothetical protein